MDKQTQGFILNYTGPYMRGLVCNAALALKRYLQTAYSVPNVARGKK